VVDAKMLARTAAVALLAGAIVTAVVTLHDRGEDNKQPPAPAAEGNDPLVSELARCKALGIEAANDASCQAAWAESRKRFFAPPEQVPPKVQDRMKSTPAGEESR
jgi:conjugative transfer region protein TrbK